MAEEFIIKLVSEDFTEGVGGKTTATASASGSSALGMGAAIGGIAVGIQQLISIVMPVVNDLLRPIKSLLTGIVRQIGEFLRPITEMVIFLLRPILMIIQPLILMFRSMLAPFMDIARGYSDMAMQQMAGGDIIGAVASSMEAVKTLIGPFIVALTSIGLQLATTMIITSMTNLVNMLIGAIGGMISFIVGIFSKDGAQAVLDFTTDLQDKITEGGNSLITTINNAIIGETNNMLDKMATDAQTKFDTYKEKHLTFLTDTYGKSPEELASLTEQSQIVSKYYAGLGGTALETLDALRALEKEDKSVKNIVDGMVKSVDDGLIDMGKEFKLSWDPNTGTFQEAVKYGYVQINTDVVSGMSKMVTNTDSGYNEVVSSSNSFLSKLKKIAKDIGDIKIKMPSVSSSGSFGVSIGGGKVGPM